MTRMLKDAHDLLDRMPEDKLPFLVEIMKGMNGLYPDDEEPASCLRRIKEVISCLLKHLYTRHA